MTLDPFPLAVLLLWIFALWVLVGLLAFGGNRLLARVKALERDVKALSDRLEGGR